MPVDEVEAFHTGQDVERPVDGQRHDRQLQFVGQGEGAFLEMGHVTCEGTCAFGEHRHAVALLQYLAGILVGLANLAGTPFVNHNLVRLLTGIAHEGNLPQLLFHHPFEVTPQMSVYQEDVKGTLMVGHEDVTLSFLQVLTPFHLDGD